MIDKFQNINRVNTHVVSLLICFILILSCAKVFAQKDADNEEIKRLQRSIFIFNFAQQVGWANMDQDETFKIGVLGPDRTILDLQVMAQKRKIQNKPVEIVRFQLVKEVENVQLLYVNNKFNYGIYYILNKIKDQGILLVSEDYNFNASMINMVNVGNSFEYEINAARLEEEGFIIAPSLRQYAITSSEKWKRLYRKTERSLDQSEKQNKEQESVIKDKEKEILYQKDKITNQEREISNQEKEIGAKDSEIKERNKKIESLYTDAQIQQKKYEEKILIERELEKNIQEQIAFIKSQQEKIESGNSEIEKRNEILEHQEAEIKEKESILTRQATEITEQKNLNALLIALVVLVLGGGGLIYRGYRNEKRLGKELEKRNTEIYQTSLELESKNKELEQFAYIASHDLQEPLNTISSFIGLIAEDYGESFDDVGKESLVFIQDASVRMKKLIDALLQYSRLGRAKEYTDVDCNKVLKELEGDLKVVIEETGAKINKNTLPVVKGSEVELRLLFQNLITNAIKFREAEKVPEIEIAASRNGFHNNISNAFWQFSVKDNGIGIPEEHQERIFAIFQRLHSREQFEGTGIGLAHCKKIVESHGGTIWLESKEGMGSTFYFTIPIK